MWISPEIWLRALRWSSSWPVMKWRVIFERDDDTGDWAVWCPELPGCTSAGRSKEEARSNIKEAIELYLSRLDVD